MKLDYTQLVERLSQRVDEMWEPEGQTKEQVASEFALPQRSPRARGCTCTWGQALQSRIHSFLVRAPRPSAVSFALSASESGMAFLLEFSLTLGKLG